jgi:hypothetical protein
VQSRGKIGVHVDMTGLPEQIIAKAAEVVITVTANESPFGTKTFRCVPAAPFYAYFDLPEAMHEQLLTFTCRVIDDQGQELVTRTLDYQLPQVAPWMGQIQIPPDYVPAPWTPLYRNVDGVIHCWNRKYVFGNAPFPQRILVGGSDVLDGPVTMHIATADGQLQWDDQPPVIETCTGAEIVMVRTGHLPGLAVTVRTTMEFDGFVYFEVTLTPSRPVELDDVRMLVPIRREVARFFHTEGAWSEKRFGAVALRDQYPTTLDERNYYWLGNDDVGLAWMTDVLAQWPINSDAPDQTRVGFRETDTGYEGYFLPRTQRQTLSQPLRLTFALQATPVRPRHEQSIRLNITYNLPPDKFNFPVSPNKRPVVMMMLGDKFNFPPYEKDEQMIREWIAGYSKMGYMFLVYQYISEQQSVDTFQKYWGDWVTKIPVHPGPSARASDWADCCLNSSWADSYLHNVDTMMKEYGADGVYLDGTMQERLCQRSDVHGPMCDRTWPLLVSRNLLKNLRYVLQRNHGNESFLWGHTSDLKIAPLIGFMDVLYEGENYCYPISYDDITSDVIRAQFGAQWGPQTFIHPQLVPSKLKHNPFTASQFLGMMTLHGVISTEAYLPDNGRDELLYPLWNVLDEFPDTDATFMRYFKQTIVTEASDQPVSMYVSRTGDRLLLIIANRTNEAATYQMQFHPDRHHGPSEIVRVTERMKDQAVEHEGATINTTLNAFEFKLLEVTLR